MKQWLYRGGRPNWLARWLNNSSAAVVGLLGSGNLITTGEILAGLALSLEARPLGAVSRPGPGIVAEDFKLVLPRPLRQSLREVSYDGD